MLFSYCLRYPLSKDFNRPLDTGSSGVELVKMSARVSRRLWVRILPENAHEVFLSQVLRKHRVYSADLNLFGRARNSSCAVSFLWENGDNLVVMYRVWRVRRCSGSWLVRPDSVSLESTCSVSITISLLQVEMPRCRFDIVIRFWGRGSYQTRDTTVWGSGASWGVFE